MLIFNLLSLASHSLSVHPTPQLFFFFHFYCYPVAPISVNIFNALPSKPVFWKTVPSSPVVSGERGSRPSQAAKWWHAEARPGCSLQSAGRLSLGGRLHLSPGRRGKEEKNSSPSCAYSSSETLWAICPIPRCRLKRYTQDMKRRKKSSYMITWPFWSKTAQLQKLAPR